MNPNVIVDPALAARRIQYPMMLMPSINILTPAGQPGQPLINFNQSVCNGTCLNVMAAVLDIQGGAMAYCATDEYGINQVAAQVRTNNGRNGTFEGLMRVPRPGVIAGIMWMAPPGSR